MSDKIHLKLNDSSIFAYHSEYKDLRLSPLEAMSYSYPLLVVKTVHPSETISVDGKNGMLVPPDFRPLAMTLAKLMDSHELRQIYGSKVKQTSIAYSPKYV